MTSQFSPEGGLKTSGGLDAQVGCPCRGRRRGSWLWRGVCAISILVAVVALAVYLLTNNTIFDLLRENRKLKAALTNLTTETQIGYAKVLVQETRDGRLFTRLRFVETDRQNPAKILEQQDFEVEGDVVHFDALMVVFEPQLVMDGKERALYIWRRVYGEKMAPEAGFPICKPGTEPRRYAEVFSKLSLRDRNMLWSEIWSLADDPDHLRQAGVRAIYGNVVYKKLRPGLIYVFKVANGGHFYPETVPAL